MTSAMDAVVFDGPASDPSRTNVVAVPGPAPVAGEVVVEVAFAGVNFKDVMSRRGDPGYVDTWPFTPGLEVAGTVTEVGPGVAEPSVGQQVVALTNAGGLAQRTVAQSALTLPLPQGLDPAVAAAAPGALTTAELLVHDAGRLRAGDTVVVHGAAGTVGGAIPQIARLVGDVRLVGVVGAETRVPAAERAGYDVVLVRGSDLTARFKRLLPTGADLIFDPQGTTLLEQDLAVLRPLGRIVLFGNAGGGPMGSLPSPGSLFGANASIAGFSLEALSRSDPARFRAALMRVLDHLATGRLALEPIVLDGLAAAAVAQQHLADGTGAGKYVVRVYR